MRLFSAIAIALLLLGNSTVSAFSEGGHKVIASIAYQRLTPAQRTKVIEILKKHPRFQEDFAGKMPDSVKNGSTADKEEWLFQQAAIWPDLAKQFDEDDKKKYSRGVWHYINRPKFLRQVDENELEDQIDVNLNVEPPSRSIDDKGMNVVQSIVNSARVIADSSQDDEDRALHVCWLLHCIGDLHQPLHSAALFSKRLFPQGDQGGNLIKTTQGKLHGVWDSQLGGKTSLSQGRTLAANLLQKPSLQADIATGLADLDPVAMWDESFEWAEDAAYSNEVVNLITSQETGSGSFQEITLSQNYLDTARVITERGAVRAGVRCAEYLAGLTDANPSAAPQLAAVRTLDTSGMLAKRSAPPAAVAAVPEAISFEDAQRLALDGGAAPAVVSALTKFDSYDPNFPPPAGIKTFELSQDYPRDYDAAEKFPWMDIDFRTNSTQYLRAVLDYCLEGNIEVDFRGQENKKRKWFHAPWMHNDSAQNPRRSGREYHHGLTSERRSRPFELHPLQTGAGFPEEKTQNWAISLYSPRGGFTLGRVWRTPDGKPDPFQANFPDNTVTFKLLFTAAPVAQVPYLEGSPTWIANINPTGPQVTFTRVDHEMRLLQVDVAVKDPRVGDSTGWIFGTFVFDGSRPGDKPFQKLVPVGLSWGDDGHEQSLIEKEGAYINPALRSSVINHELLPPPAANDWGPRAFVRHHGLGGRLNGPVDNPSSSCISCHGRAGLAVKQPGLAMVLINKSGSVPEQIVAFKDLFSPIRPGAQIVRAKDPNGALTDFVTVDYSLQVSIGIRNYYAANPQARAAAARIAPGVAGLRAAPATTPTTPLPIPSRGED